MLDMDTLTYLEYSIIHPYLPLVALTSVGYSSK